MITERIDNVTKIPLEYRMVNPPAPKSVKIELTGKCNYRCGYCPLMTRESPGRDMDWDLFTDIILEVKELGINEVGIFFMGESFTNGELLIRAIKFLKNVNIPYVFLTSNASLAKKDIVYQCMKSGLDSLKWSCNIANKQQFKEIVGVKESIFDNALTNIKDAFEIREKNGFKTKLYASSIRYDDEQLQRMEKLLKEKIIPYVDQHYWLPLYSMGSLARTKEIELGLKPIAGNTGRFDNPVAPIPCWTLFTESHIMSDGRMTACCADATGEWVMGNLSKQSFMDAWHSEDFQELRKNHLEDNILGTKCENCIMYK